MFCKTELIILVIQKEYYIRITLDASLHWVIQNIYYCRMSVKRYFHKAPLHAVGNTYSCPFNKYGSTLCNPSVWQFESGGKICLLSHSPALYFLRVQEQ